MNKIRLIIETEEQPFVFEDFLDSMPIIADYEILEWEEDDESEEN